MRKQLAARLVPLLLGLMASAVAAQVRESFTFDGRTLEVSNLIGAIEVTAASGRDFEVEVRVSGRDGSAGTVTFDARRGSRSELEIRFPTDREQRYVYPALGRGSSSFHVDDSDRSWIRNLIGAITGDSIKVSGRGRGLEVWADVTIAVPRGGELALRHGVGAINVEDVDGELELSQRSGGVSVRNSRGRIEIDAGSGAIDLEDIVGDLWVDTGSGGVSLARFDGEEVEIDTGSGTVSVEDVRCRRLVVDTGSGGVRASRIATENALIDTGSGSVVLALIEMGDGDFEIDTGSGSITLLVPPTASAMVDADTGSGGVDVELAGIETLSKDRDEMRFRVGGGAARVHLDTGSGRIRVAAVD